MSSFFIPSTSFSVVFHILSNLEKSLRPRCEIINQKFGDSFRLKHNVKGIPSFATMIELFMQRYNHGKDAAPKKYFYYNIKIIVIKGWNIEIELVDF